MLVVLCSFLFFYRLGDRGLGSSHEARAAQNAQSILSEDDWLLPQLFDRRVELQKPPLYYWLVALLAKLLGGAVDAWAVRLPAALAGVAVVLLVYGFCAWRGRPLAGFIAAAILATSVHFTWLARIGRIDMPLTLAVVVTVAGLLRAPSQAGGRAWPWLLLAYLAAAGGLLLKGPIALVLPAVILLAARWTEGKARQPWRCWLQGLGLWWGIPLLLIVAGPWYVLAGLQTRGDFLRVFFWLHNVERGMGGDPVLSVHPWWLYFARLPVDLLPWSLLLPVAGWFFLREKAWREDAEARFGLAWLTAIFVLLQCLSFKRPDYLLPAYPGAALFLGCVAERWWQARRGSAVSARSASGTWCRSAPCGLVAALAVVVVGWWLYLDFINPGREASLPTERFATAIRSHTRASVLFFRAEDHELAFHVGRPVDTLVEWENLDVWLARPAPVYVVMPASCAAERDLFLKNGRLQVLLGNADLGEASRRRQLVLLTRP
jgi:4-amino-4-deoxy-L-arabinose transferase-like glycosyltransferase